MKRPGVEPLVSSGTRCYELGRTPDAALDRLRSPSNPPVLSFDEAKRATSNDPFIVLSGDGFTIYKPWHAPLSPIRGPFAQEMAVGPAVTGRLVSTPRGSRLDVRVRRYALAPAQRFKVGAIAVATAAVLSVMLAAVGAHPVLLGLVAVPLLGVAVSVLFYQHRQRSQDIRDLLAVVERAFGPLELPSGDDAPYRDHDPDDHDS